MEDDQLDDDTDIGMESETQGDEEDSEDDPSSSPALSAASTPPYTAEEGFFPPPKKASIGKPLSIKRRRGRPKKDQEKKPLGIKLKRWKSGLYVKGDSTLCSRQPRTPTSAPDTPQSQKSPCESPIHTSISGLDAECKELTVNLGEKVEKFEKIEKPFPMLAPDDPPYFPETWPGKICALCNLTERSQLGQREMIRLSCPEGFVPRKTNPSPGQSPSSHQSGSGDKSPRGGQTPHQISHRRQKSREGKTNGEVLDELSVVGYSEEPDVNLIFEPTGTFYVHMSCILWSGVNQNESDLQLENPGPAVVLALSRRCSYCARFGASVMCSFSQNQSSCSLYFHYPCALASGGFMENKTKTLICNLHLDQVPLLSIGESSQCSTCLSLGNVSNILMCTTCGSHHHGSCVGLALLPGVRAGWQCFECRVCQVCRQPSEIGKIMLCETCDKAYHPACLRPIVTSIPKYGWKCKCCRVCSDCGSRTPGSGLSSRWHNHFSVCDSCYQQRNKGYCCPVCGRAYRAAAHREMVQCTKCRKYVHGTCDSEADLSYYTNKKDANPDYEYVCTVCKNLVSSGRQAMKRKDSFDEALLESSLSASQESLYGDDLSGMEVDHSPSENKSYDDYPRSIGLGKGKPFCSSNSAKKRFMSRPKGQQSGGKINYQKMKKMAEFGKKRGIKTKMRGVFGVPGLGLQRPQADPSNKNDEEPGVENRMVLCSSADKFVLSQDICVMCGALGTDQEGCLIACAQCGQCYHPYCVNVKVTKVILQKGWRCLDCTVCEGCGQRNDDSRLTLCDDCDISYHIYCMDPPLDYVPRGVWKCKWCVVCVRCGSYDPGFNSNWMNGYTECGPCASHTICPSCQEPYIEGDLVIQCEQCERWLHGFCDGIRNEVDAEKCADERYTCLLCRPRDVPPPHLLPPPPPKPVAKSPTPTKSPELPRFSQTQFLVDGVCLSESGMRQIKSLSIEQQVTQRKKRTTKRIASLLPGMDKEARFLATIESVVSGTEGKSPPPSSPGLKEEEDNVKEESLKEEPLAELWKEGMEVAPREDGKPPEPPEGFTIVTTDGGVMVLRKKRTRNLQKLGIGGFLVRVRSNRKADDEDEPQTGEKTPSIQPTDKPKRKSGRKKTRGKLVESFPSYLQEAFFGRELLDTPKEKELHSSSEDELASKFNVTDDKTIELSKDELKVMEDVKARQEKEKEEKEKQKAVEKDKMKEKSPVKTEDEGSDSEVLKDLNLKDLPLPGDLLDTDLVNTIMAEGDDIKTSENLDAAELNETFEPSGGNQSKDELTDILSSMSGLPNMDTKDLEEIFKGVESQENQSGFTGGLQLNPSPSLPTQNILPSSFPPPSPYHSEYSNSPHSQLSEPPSPWLDDSSMSVDQTPPQGSQSIKATLAKFQADELLGLNATISSVLYCNTNHPELKTQYPSFPDRYKQILKKWRSLQTDQKAPFLQKSRDNRSVQRMKKTQQIPKESPTIATSPSGSAVAKGSPSGEQKKLIPTTVSQQLAGEGEVCEAAASEEAALKTQSLTTNTSDVIGSDDRGSSVVESGDEKPVAGVPSSSADSGSQTEGAALKTTPQLENKAVRVLLTPVDNSQARPQNFLFRNVVIANNPNNHNFTIHHHFSGVSAPQYVQNEPIIIATQSQTQQNGSFNVRNILAQNNQNVIQFPNYARFPSHFHLDISNRAPNVTIRAFETGGLSHLTRSQISSHGQAFVHRPMTLTLPQTHSSTHISEIKILHPASHILHTPQVIHSRVQSPTNVEPKHEEPEKVSPPEIPEQRSSDLESQAAAEESSVQDEKSKDVTDKIGFNRLLIVSDQSNQQSKAMESKVQIVQHKEEEKSESNEPNDHQIRVLTPSEIMRTLPSLGPDGYDVARPSQTTPPTPPNHSHMDQEKALQQQKVSRESEQERNWKQLQALRQAQAQQQQQVIHEQRVQAMARINRQMTGAEETNPNLTIQLQVSTNQDPSAMVPLGSQFPQNSNVKVTRIHPSQSPNPFSHPLAPPSPHLNRPLRTQTPNYQSRQFSPNQTSPLPDFPGTPSPNSESDPYGNPRAFSNQSPRMPFSPQSPRPPPPPHPPRPAVMFTDANRRPEENYQVPQGVQSPEVTRQLRDLLQRQKEGATVINAPQVQQRPWPSGPEFPEGQEATFRHPLPPGNMSRPRIPVQQVLVRTPVRPAGDPRMQGAQDQRMRLLIHQRPQGIQGAFPVQQPQAPQQQQQQQQPPPSPARNPLDPYEDMVQSRHAEGGVLQQRLVSATAKIRTGTSAGNVIAPAQPVPANTDQQEIPESVTAELEQLESEGGPMVAEAEAVSAILGDLADDDDELLAEMGADFNILEYVDTETTHGDKTNILDNLELEDEETKEKKLKEGSSAGKGASGKTLPPPTPVTAAKPKPEPPPEGRPKPPEAPQIHPSAEILSQISTDDLPTEGLEPRFPPTLSRVPVPVPVPVAVDPQRLPMRVGAVGAQGSTRVIMAPNGQIIQGLPVQNRISGIAVAQPPPPPYPGPPPPYPGPQQMPPARHGVGLMPPQEHLPPHLQRRPLLLQSCPQEQPLLLEDLLEQEKREQEKQQLQAPDVAAGSLVADIDVDQLREVAPTLPPSGMIAPSNVMNPGVRPQFPRPPFMPGPSPPPPPPRAPPFNAPVLQPPPMPPDVVSTDQDRQAAIEYETWLNHQNQILQQQLKYYETEVQKLRKVRKSLNSKQRQLRKNGNELSEQDALELQRISAEQSALQKHLDASRKSFRQHGMLIQEYKTKQQKQNRQNSPLHPGSSPLNPASQSPLHSNPTGAVNPSQSPMHIGGQTTSPMHSNVNYGTSSHPSTPQSPMMSPSPSPLHSPGPVVSQSPGGGMLQSPMSPHSMQQSPRLGTPHSQTEESPFSPGSLPSPGPGRLASPQTPAATNPRLPSPQHRARLVTSPGLPDQMGRLHMNLGPRYVRAPIGPDARLRGPGPQPSATVYQSPGQARVIYAPKQNPPDQNQILQRGNLTREQVIQRNLLLQQQQQQLRNQQFLNQISQQNPNLTMEQKQKLLQLHQQKQQQLLLQQRQQLIDQQMIQQQQQLAAQNQQRVIQNQNSLQNVPISSPQRNTVVQNNHNIHSLPQSSQNSPSPLVSAQNPKSPISPMIQMPQSPMNLPPKSPIAASPLQKSPMIQPQSSPIVQSPLNLPPRSPSVGSPLNKHPAFFGNNEGLMQHSMQEEGKQENLDADHGGGGRNAPIPYLENIIQCARSRPGLRGGSPMWSFGKGKRPKRSDEERSRTPIENEGGNALKSSTGDKPVQNVIKTASMQRMVRPGNAIHSEPSTSCSVVSSDGNRGISLLRQKRESGIELQQSIVLLRGSPQLQLQSNQQKVIIQQMPAGNVQPKNFPIQKNVPLLQGQKVFQKKMPNPPQNVPKRTSLVCLDYGVDEETPPASPSHRADELEQKNEKMEEKTEEEEEEIRIATDAESLELLSQENLLNLELEESDEGNGRRVIIIDNSEEGTSGSEKYEDNPNGSPTVMEFMDDDVMVYGPIEGVISDSEEVVVLEECEVLEAHEFDITNCEVMEIESVDENETEEPSSSKAVEELGGNLEETKTEKEPNELKEIADESEIKPEPQKQQIIVRHTRKGKQIVMVKRGEEGKDQRRVIYSSEKDSKDLEDETIVLSRSSSEEEKSVDEIESKKDVDVTSGDATDFKKLIEQSEIIIMDDNGDIQKTETEIPKKLASDDEIKKSDSVTEASSASKKFVDSPLSPEPLREKIQSPAKVVVNSEENTEVNLPDPRLAKTNERNSKANVPCDKPEEEKQAKVAETAVASGMSGLPFPDFPEGLASKFFSETSSDILSECSILRNDEKGSPVKESESKDVETDQTSVIRAPKTYEKVKIGKSKVQLTEHDYTHIPGKVESFRKEEPVEEKGKAEEIVVKNILLESPLKSDMLPATTCLGLSGITRFPTMPITAQPPAQIFEDSEKGDDSFEDLPETSEAPASLSSAVADSKPENYPLVPVTSPKTEASKTDDAHTSEIPTRVPGTVSCPIKAEPKPESVAPVPSEISSHIAKIDPKVRDVISISKITEASGNFSSSTLSPIVTTSSIITTPLASVPVLTSLSSVTKPEVPVEAKTMVKGVEEAKKTEMRRKSLETIGRRKSVEERRRSTEAASRESKRELEQRKQLILEEIKQAQLDQEKLKGSSKQDPLPEPKTETPKTEHDLSDVIDILENIDSTPTRLLNASELQSIDKTQLFENEELEKTPPQKAKPEVQKFDENINLQSLLSDTGKSDLKMSDLARGLSAKATTQVETRTVPPATQSKLAALLTGGSDAVRPKIHKEPSFSGSGSLFEVRKDSVPTLESLLEKEVETKKKSEEPEKAEAEKKEAESEDKTDLINPVGSPGSQTKTENLNVVNTSGNLILSPTSGIFRSSGSNLGVPASKILSPSTGITLSGATPEVKSEETEAKSCEAQRQTQGILLSSGQSIIQQNAIVSSSAISGNQQGIIISDRNLITAVNSPGVLMTTARLLQPASKNAPSPTRSSPLSVLPPGVRQQIITTNYIQQNRANPVLVRRISTPSPPRVRTPPQTQSHLMTSPTQDNPQNTYQRTFRAVTQNSTPISVTTNASFPQRLPVNVDASSRIVVTSGSQLIASSQLQRLSVSQGLSIPTAVMSATINPSSLSLDNQSRLVNQPKMYGSQNNEVKLPDAVQPNAIKTEPTEIKEERFSPYAAQSFGNKFPRTDESQNVLLKQLLQNTACAASSSSMSPTPPTANSSLPIVPSLEAQLARPVPPTPSSLIPTLLTDQKSTPGSPTQAKAIRLPGKEQPRPAPNIEARRISQSNRTPSREDLLSPTNSTRSSFGLRTPSPITSPQAGVVSIKPIPEAEIKKELPDDVRQEPSIADRLAQEQAALDRKKLKRRQYQQKRRQSQGKEGASGGTPKKRARKGSRMEEDYESYTDSLMTQLRQLPALSIMEPDLDKNYNVCAAFGSGDHGRASGCEVRGAYGNGVIPSAGDYYTTKPFGDKEKPPPTSPVSTQRGFYDQEFPAIQLTNDSEEKRLEALLSASRERDTDTPDTVVSSSSPECVLHEPSPRFPALQLIKEEPLSDDEVSRLSPVMPIVAPIPIRLKPGQTLKEFKEMDKENACSGAKKNVPIKDGNVTVTLTLNSDAAQDVLGVLKDLANILHIPAPTTYQIVERTATPPSIKLGLYRNKGKDGKEGAPVDIQSILNGQAKFCRHCDVVILNNMIRKKVSELPFLSEREDITDNTEDLYFCSSSCYMQFSLMHKSPNNNQDKAGTVVDHLSHSTAKRPRLSVDEKDGSKAKAKDVKKEPDVKKPNKGNRYKYWAPGALQSSMRNRYKKPTERELMEMLFRVGVTLTPSQNSDDTRRCLFCHQIGDGVADGPARLLNFDVDKWVHLNCALWSDDVYETVNGALMNVDNALQLGQTTVCSLCNQNGATIHCFKLRCSNVYHLGCAVKDECVFFKNKTTYCPAHVPKNEKDNELTTLSVYRRVYVQRDENRQVATVMHHTDQNHLLRVGSLIFLNVGQLLPHQLPVFHTPNYIYPVGYKIIRFYWSMRRPNKRCKYVCSIHDAYGRPEFRILVQEPSYDDIELRDSSPKAVWGRILEPLQQLRKDNANVQIFPRYVTGEDLFGLNEPAVVRVLESLPGVETLTDYKFKYGRNPLLELPLAVNPTGCARSEPRQKNLLPYKRPHTQRTATTSRPNLFSPTLPGLSNEALCPYSKQFVHSKSSQYKKMKLEWRNNVYLARSKIQGLGLYAARDLERHTMVIEYIGEIIRHELSESREKQYEARNRGIYMFRLDEERVIDATISGGLARYINHSCNPNCVAEIVEVDRDLRIIIFAKRRITRGEELAYDYKFDIEDDQHKIPCLCGAPNCRKWMN